MCSRFKVAPTLPEHDETREKRHVRERLEEELEHVRGCDQVPRRRHRCERAHRAAKLIELKNYRSATIHPSDCYCIARPHLQAGQLGPRPLL